MKLVFDNAECTGYYKRALRVAPLPQLDRGTDYESVRRGFESLTAHHLNSNRLSRRFFFMPRFRCGRASPFRPKARVLRAFPVCEEGRIVGMVLVADKFSKLAKKVFDTLGACCYYERAALKCAVTSAG